MSPRVESAEVCRIAVIGDIHGSWDDQDVQYFNDSDYDLLLFVGDLGGGTLRSDLAVARSIARLSLPALVMPGNNDAIHLAQLAAEFLHQKGLIRLLSVGQQRRSRSLATALGEVQMVGYSLHSISHGNTAFDIIACRPHPMGGPSLSFVPHLERAYGIRSLEESAEKLISLVDSATSSRIIFFAHNGPTGLGDRAGDIWGCDFKREEGDWGDPDLEVAIDHAIAQGKQAIAVLGGHMHLRTKQGTERPWRLEKNGIHYVNAARVPRIFPKEKETLRHHVALDVGAESISLREVFHSSD